MGEKMGAESDYNILNGMVKMGWRVVHITPLDKGQDPSEIFEGIKIIRIKNPFIYLQGTFVLQFLSQVMSWFLFNFRSLALIRRLSRNESFDLVYGHTALSGPATYLVGRMYRIPSIIRLYGTFLYPCLGSCHRMLLNFQEIIGFRLPVTQLIVTNDGTQGDKVAKELGVPNKKLRFWRNGVDKQMYNPDFDTNEFMKELGLDYKNRIVLAVSRLVSWKRLDRLVKAVPSIILQDRKVVFIVVGDGPERKALETLTQNLEVSQYIRFIGAVPHENVADYMNAADIFVSVNDLSNVSNGLIEAMVCGKCIVTLDTGDTGELIKESKTGRLVRVGKEDEIVSELSKAILDVLQDDYLRTRLGYNARIYAQEHFQTWEERITMEIKQLEGLIAQNNR